MIIYLDIVFGISTYCHWMILQLTNEFISLGAKWYRILLGSIVASSIIPIVLYFPHSFFTSIVCLIILSVITIIFTFGLRHIRLIGKIVFTFYCITFTLGGGLLALSYSRLYFNQFTLTNQVNESISAFFVLLGVPSLIIFIRILKRKLEKDKIISDDLYPIKIRLNGKTVATTGFIDSGNQLIEPISKRPVAICDEAFLMNFFTESDWKYLTLALKENQMDILPNHLKKLISVVPFHTVGGENNTIYTLKPEKLIIHYKNNTLILTKFLIGINWTHLISDRSYECLLHPGMIIQSKNKVA